MVKAKPCSPREQRFPRLHSLWLRLAGRTSIPSHSIPRWIPQSCRVLDSRPASAFQPLCRVCTRLSPFSGTAVGCGGFGQSLPRFGAGCATRSSPIREPLTSPELCVMAQFSELKRKHPFPLLFLGFRLKKSLCGVSLQSPCWCCSTARSLWGSWPGPRCRHSSLSHNIIPGFAAPSLPALCLISASGPLAGKPVVPSGAAPSGLLFALDLLFSFPANHTVSLSLGHTAPAATAIVPLLRAG